MLKRTMIKTFIFAAALFAGAASAEEGAGLENAQSRPGNLSSVQSGARLFFNYCSGCHSLKYMSYSQLADDLHLSKDDVLRSFAFSGAKIGDQVLTNMPGDNAKAWFGNTPPDLSLEARAKGPDWIYTYLKSFYLDPSRPTGWNNTVFPSVSMPNVLWELQGSQRAVMAPAKTGEDAHVEKLELASPGRLTSTQFDEAARDLTTFLDYAGEPAKLKREAMGAWVVLYLAFFTFLAYLLKHEFWKDVH